MSANKDESGSELPRTLDTSQVAELLRISPVHVTRLARAGKLPGTKVTGQWLFLESEMLKLLKGEHPSD
ncbi:helix-turn-helix domain-containing protein [Amycolatopsis sp. NPDC051903]|uniref:helix-turn-helix domain-containing protein n=1 Tax=Amycolatopsis sp. NPDC051903 TaxID=3363936 RepID=UPI003790E5D5